MKKTLILFDGPQGVGKDAVIRELIKSNPKLKSLPSYATRKMRTGEVNGDTHWFIDDATFLKKLETGDIFEHTIFHNTYRGMSKAIIDEILNNGSIGIKSIDILGLRLLRKMYPNQVLSIFITADKNIIRNRLAVLGDPEIDARLSNYDERHKYINESDYIVENNGTLDEVVQKVQAILSGHI